MGRELRVRDRMRMSVRSRVEDYPPGAKGVVWGGPKESARSGAVYYLVSMDKDVPGQTTIFNAEEIEPDESPPVATGAEDRSMSHELRMGDRVRVTTRSRVKGYQPGDKGVVLEVPTVYAGAVDTSYVVAMDKDGPGSISTVFSADDIEADV